MSEWIVDRMHMRFVDDLPQLKLRLAIEVTSHHWVHQAVTVAIASGFLRQKAFAAPFRNEIARLVPFRISNRSH